MKKNILLLTTSLLFQSNTFTAASHEKDAPVYGSVTSALGSAIGWLQKKTGTKSIEYCIDAQAQGIYDTAERRVELRYATDREQKKTKTYGTLMSDAIFVNSLKQLNDRAYFDWQHILDAIQNDRYQDVHRFYKYNRVNASPCLRTAAYLYLMQNKKEREHAPKPKDDGPRFDLLLTEAEHGYLESSVPQIPEENHDFPTLMKTIRERSKELIISSPGKAAERRLRKSLGGSFSDAYLKSADEVKKSQAVYAVYFAHLYSTYKIENAIIDLFKDQSFIDIYNQVWDRDNHLRERLQDQLRRGSLDACLIYEHHRFNICPIFAALVCDMILSNENRHEVPERFKELYLASKKPYGKIIFMFLNSLNKNQKRALLASKDEILATESRDYSATVHGKIRANDAQLELLAEIQDGDQIGAMFEKLEQSVVKNDTDSSDTDLSDTDSTRAASSSSSSASSSSSCSESSSVSYATSKPIAIPTRDPLSQSMPILAGATPSPLHKETPSGEAAQSSSTSSETSFSSSGDEEEDH